MLDGSDDSERRLQQMLYWDVNNGISRRSWARNEPAMFAIKRAMQENQNLKITLPNLSDEQMINRLFIPLPNPSEGRKDR
jgi:urocanate hydratase